MNKIAQFQRNKKEHICGAEQYLSAFIIFGYFLELPLICVDVLIVTLLLFLDGLKDDQIMILLTSVAFVTFVTTLGS